MKNTSKILALVLVVMTLLMGLSTITAGAEDAANTVTVTKVLEASAIGAQAAGTWADVDGKEVLAGTDDFFTLVLSTKSKVDTSNKEWTEESYPGNAYKSGYRINLGGKSTSTANFIKFTTTSPATLKVWWVSNGDDRNNVILDAEGNTIATIDAVTKNSLAFNEVTLSAAGTYSFTTVGGSNYIFKIEVSWTVAGADSSTCEHEFSEATCLAPKTCSKCFITEGEALGHAPGEAATCTSAQICTRCELELVPALGHTLTFVNTLPTAEAAGKTVADCSVCGAHFDFGEVNVMTPGTYEFDAADLGDIAQYSLFDGEVRIVDGVFACHLSNKYYNQSGRTEQFTLLGWTATYRMNLQGKSEFLNNGEGEEAVRNGGLKNFIQIVTTDETTVTIAWQAGGANREMGIFDMEGNPIAVTEELAEKNGLCVSVLTVPAGSYLIGTYFPEGVAAGGNYIYKIIVDVEAPHTHVWSDATCTEPAKCECGETNGEALGHTWVDATCTAPKTCSVCGETEGEALGHTFVDGVCSCGEKDPNAVEPDPVDPVDPEPEEELNFFQKIIAWFMDLINKFLAIFKK